jgi:hypothetical protein
LNYYVDGYLMQTISAPCCEPILAKSHCSENGNSWFSLVLYACIFSLGILSKALLLGMLPLAGHFIAPNSILTTLPVVMLLSGWISTSLIRKSVTSDSLRLELTSAIGVFGGLLTAYSLWTMSMSGLCIATFCLGFSQGSSFAIRHKAAKSQQGGNGHWLSIIFGAALIVGLIGPVLSQWMEGLFQPVVFVGTALLAAFAHALSAILAAVTEQQVDNRVPETSDNIKKTSCCKQANASCHSSYSSYWPHLATSFAWFLMIMGMTAGPLALAYCGIDVAGASQAVSWHLCAMFAPALCLGTLNHYMRTQTIINLGLIIGVSGICLLLFTFRVDLIMFGMILSGAGWSLTTSASSLWISQNSDHDRTFQKHDCIVYSSALLGALVSGLFF